MMNRHHKRWWKVCKQQQLMCEYSVDVRIFHGLLARSCGTAPSFVDPSSVVPSDLLLRKPDSDVLLLRCSVTLTDKRFEKCVWCCSQNEFHHFALWCCSQRTCSIWKASCMYVSRVATIYLFLFSVSKSSTIRGFPAFIQPIYCQKVCNNKKNE